MEFIMKNYFLLSVLALTGFVNAAQKAAPAIQPGTLNAALNTDLAVVNWLEGNGQGLNSSFSSELSNFLKSLPVNLDNNTVMALAVYKAANLISRVGSEDNGLIETNTASKIDKVKKVSDKTKTVWNLRVISADSNGGAICGNQQLKDLFLSLGSIRAALGGGQEHFEIGQCYKRSQAPLTDDAALAHRVIVAIFKGIEEALAFKETLGETAVGKAKGKLNIVQPSKRSPISLGDFVAFLQKPSVALATCLKDPACLAILKAEKIYDGVIESQNAEHEKQIAQAIAADPAIQKAGIFKEDGMLLSKPTAPQQAAFDAEVKRIKDLEVQEKAKNLQYQERTDAAVSEIAAQKAGLLITRTGILAAKVQNLALRALYNRTEQEIQQKPEYSQFKPNLEGPFEIDTKISEIAKILHAHYLKYMGPQEVEMKEIQQKQQEQKIVTSPGQSETINPVAQDQILQEKINKKQGKIAAEPNSQKNEKRQQQIADLEAQLKALQAAPQQGN